MELKYSLNQSTDNLFHQDDKLHSQNQPGQKQLVCIIFIVLSLLISKVENIRKSIESIQETFRYNCDASTNIYESQNNTVMKTQHQDSMEFTDRLHIVRNFNGKGNNLGIG